MVKNLGSFPALTFGLLRYRYLEMTKSEILKLYRNRFDKTISVSVKEKLEMQWWIIIVFCNHIVVTNPDIMIYTDPSLIGWGIIDHNTPSR